MSIRRISVFLIVILLGLSLSGAAFLAARKKSLSSTLQDLAARGFSGGILIASGETVLTSEGYGFASCDDRVPNTADTVFAIGSITKMFTAAAIGQLDDQGLLDIDDPVSRYFDDVPDDKAAITIRQLLDHTAGLQTYHETQRLGDFEAMTREQALTEILKRPLLFAPGDDENYSNSGYTWLALLIERVTGQTYTAYVRDQILEPAEMTSTGFWGESFEPIASTPNEVLGCSAPDTWDYSWVLVGNGGMVSTIGDLHRWVLALQSDVVLSDSAKQRIGFDQILQTGFSDAGGSSQHEFNGSITYLAEANAIVIAISNRDTLRAEEISNRLLFTMLNERLGLWSTLQALWRSFFP